jgi:hypothetical protein
MAPLLHRGHLQLSIAHDFGVSGIVSGEWAVVSCEFEA